MQFSWRLFIFFPVRELNGRQSVPWETRWGHDGPLKEHGWEATYRSLENLWAAPSTMECFSSFHKLLAIYKSLMSEEAYFYFNVYNCSDSQLRWSWVTPKKQLHTRAQGIHIHLWVVLFRIELSKSWTKVHSCHLCYCRCSSCRKLQGREHKKLSHGKFHSPGAMFKDTVTWILPVCAIGQ